MSGDILVENVEGEIDVNTMSGSITLNDVSGSVSTHTMNRDIMAKLYRVAVDKPMSFSSFNADIDVTLPEDIKATFVINTMGGIFGFRRLCQENENPHDAGIQQKFNGCK